MQNNMWALPAVETDYSDFNTFAAAVRAQSQNTERVKLAPSDARKIRVEADGDRLLITRGQSGYPLTSWAAGQLAVKAGAPWNQYVKGLPASAVESYLNPGLAKAEWDSGASVIATADADGAVAVRGINTASYGVISNVALINAIEAAMGRGWAQAEPSKASKRSSFTLSSERADALLTLSEGERPVNDGKHQIDRKGLGVFTRALRIANGDVGNLAAIAEFILSELICTNGAMVMREQNTTRRRHIGNVAERDFLYAVREMLTRVPDMSDELAVIAKARQTELAPPDATDEQVVKATLRIIGSGIVSESTLQLARTAAVQRQYVQNAAPNTVWGQASGMTWISQSRSRGEQATIDRAAGKLVQSVRIAA